MAKNKLNTWIYFSRIYFEVQDQNFEPEILDDPPDQMIRSMDQINAKIWVNADQLPG